MKSASGIITTWAMAHVCKFCGEEFKSRNAIFRHLRSSRSCYDLAQAQAQSTAIDDDEHNGGKVKGNFLKLEKRKVAIQFGYHVSNENVASSEKTSLLGDHYDDVMSKSFAGNEVAAGIICEAFFQTMSSVYPNSPFDQEEASEGGVIFTLASAAQLRHPSLMQERSTSACSDVVGINYKGGPDDFNIEIEKFLNLMQDIIHTIEKDRDGRLLTVKVLDIQSLSVSTKFHAERSCSQRCYQYLIPIQWLDCSAETLKWIQKAACPDATGHQKQSGTTPASLIRFKKALRLAESRDLTDIPSSSAASSAGRFGKLWQKEKRPFHNFCDSSLGSGGMASPSNVNVWRSVDRARLCGFVTTAATTNKKEDADNDQAFVVVEFRGDSFVAQQVRRMVASAIAISNDWLPCDFFNIATRLNVQIETPLAPPGLLYSSTPRFHFVELVQGSSVFGSGVGNSNAKNWLISLQSTLAQARMQKIKEEKMWLDEVQNMICPRIRSVLTQISLEDARKIKQIQMREKEGIKKNKYALGEELELTPAPKPYVKTLSLLQKISGEKMWPKTSSASTRVIKSPAEVDQTRKFVPSLASSVTSQYQGHLFQCGSFTIVNPKIFQGEVPPLNEKFPELVEAVFELEEYLSSQPIRNCINDGDRSVLGREFSSSHCTVIRNVEFTPHFHSGKGREGSYSTIVGLGDYAGGEFDVDGRLYKIRYEPLQFNGWRQIHSSKSFRGEFFSLIWFTQERRKDQGLNSVRDGISFEDAQAEVLVENHAHSLPSYPPLSFRRTSTDALVVNEILDREGCTYELSQGSWLSMTAEQNQNMNEVIDTETSNVLQNAGFRLESHDIVLDIGAHIGVFCRYALGIGCKKVFAYEPEKENWKILLQNVQPLPMDCVDGERGMKSEDEEQKVDIYQYAVAHGEPGMQTFVHARNRTDGSLNTWRHSLEKHSNYVDKKGGAKLISQAQDATLLRSQVKTVPFFGGRGAKDGYAGSNAALVPGITFVKMDCEGAEVDILLSPEASQRSNWMDVKKLVFEWSFTKERRVDKFCKAVQNLESAGFVVVYEGKGSWWDTDANCMWPFHSDLIVFARMF